MWHAEADTELTLSASPTTAVGQKALFRGKNFVNFENKYMLAFRRKVKIAMVR